MQDSSPPDTNNFCRLCTLQLDAGAHAAIKCEEGTLIPIIHNPHRVQPIQGNCYPQRGCGGISQKASPVGAHRPTIDPADFAARSCSSAPECWRRRDARQIVKYILLLCQRVKLEGTPHNLKILEDHTYNPKVPCCLTIVSLTA